MAQKMGLFCHNGSSTYWCKKILPHSGNLRDQRLWWILQLRNHHHWYSCYQSLKLVLDIHHRMVEYFHCHKLLKSRKEYYVLKFVYSEKATKFCEISSYFCLLYIQTKVMWRFRKILWPSQIFTVVCIIV